MANSQTELDKKFSEYKNPEVLVSTTWVSENLDNFKNDKIILVESNEDPLLYPSGHIPGAVEIDWQADLNDQVIRDYLDKEKFEALLSAKGISNDTTVIFYGDKSNWWACYAFWIFQLFGHTKAKIMDGGKNKWTHEKRPITRDVPKYPATSYKAPERNDTKERAFRDQVLVHIKESKKLVDVRSTPEYTGEKLHMEGYPQEGSLRGGHIPGAKSVPWSRATKEDSSFKTFDDLKALYEQEQGLKATDDIITYCRIGERSSHTWFVLKYLLGYQNVRNYDGSWTEWGNLIGVPIEKSI